MKLPALKTLLPYMALLVVAVLMAIPLFDIGFNTSDDFQYYVTAQQSWDYWAMDHYYYAITGRFYFLITKYFYYVPYLPDNFLAAKVIQYGTLYGAYLLFVYLVGRVLHSRKAALITLLLLLINTVAAPPNYFIAVASYPFYFTFSLIIFLLGCLMYVNHYQRPEGERRLWRPWVGGLLIFISFLFYETYLIFAMMLGLYVIVRHWRREGLAPMLRKRATYHETLPLLVAAIVYVAIYMGYRIYLQHIGLSFYDGTSFNAATFSLSNFWQVMYKCATIALPGQIFFHKKGLIADYSLLPGGHSNSPLSIMGHASPTTWICALLAAGLLWWLTKKPSTLSWRQIVKTVVVGTAIALFAHTLIAVSEKYNADWASWMKGYVTSLYAYFGVALVLMAAVTASLKGMRHTGWRKVLRILWCCILFYFTLLNGYTNEHMARALACNKNRVEILNHMGRSGYFDALPEDAIVYTDALHRFSQMAFAIANDTEDIEDLINLRCKHKLRCTDKYEKLKEYAADTPEAPFYFINAIEAKKTGELLVVLAQVEGLPDSPEEARTSHADLFYLSPEKSYTIVYTSASGTHLKTVEAPKREAITHSTLDDEGINPWEIVVSDMMPHNLYYE